MPERNAPTVFADATVSVFVKSLTLLAMRRTSFSSSEKVANFRVVLAERFGMFTRTKGKAQQCWSYSAAGPVSFFGDDLVRVNGARGENWTETLPVHFAWMAAA